MVPPGAATVCVVYPLVRVEVMVMVMIVCVWGVCVCVCMWVFGRVGLYEN